MGARVHERMGACLQDGPAPRMFTPRCLLSARAKPAVNIPAAVCVLHAAAPEARRTGLPAMARAQGRRGADPFPPFPSPARHRAEKRLRA